LLWPCLRSSLLADAATTVNRYLVRPVTTLGLVAGLEESARGLLGVGSSLLDSCLGPGAVELELERLVLVLLVLAAFLAVPAVPVLSAASLTPALVLVLVPVLVLPTLLMPSSLLL
jgi:hypothetical protein